MTGLIAVAFLGGLITGCSPCIVPVLPAVMAGGSSGTGRARPFLIIAGLVVSFSVTVLLGVTILSVLGLPQDFLFWLGVVVLGVLALSLMVPAIGYLTERPFLRLGSTRYAPRGGGFVLGLSLGLVFVPCAGPVLTAISVAAANHRVSGSALLVTLFYSAGAALPLLVLSLLAQRATVWKNLRGRLPGVRRISGAVLALTTLAIALGLFQPLQRDVPGYTSALEQRVESGKSVAAQLRHLSGEQTNTFVQAASGAGHPDGSSRHRAKDGPVKSAAARGDRAVDLPRLGRARNFEKIVAWLNTPEGRPLTMAELRGKVVLIDFWTYSCINCQRALPHVEAWYKDYKNYGFVVVGVHTPEFDFEHVVSNVRAAAKELGVDYPVAVDSNYGTWDAWDNEYWPADYLVDASGEVRAYSFGEGGYTTMEDDIRELLVANGAKHLPPPTDVPNRAPTQQTTPESYLGNAEITNEVGTTPVKGTLVDYHPPETVPLSSFTFSGWWADNSEEATAHGAASIELHFVAHDVYLVMAGSGTVHVDFNGRPLESVHVGGIPKLYTLFSGKELSTGLLKLNFSPGIEAYDFTFG